MNLRMLFTFIACILLFLTGCESKSTIVHGLDESAANEIMVLLAKDGLAAYKLPQSAGGGPGAAKEVLWDISVDSADRMKAMAVLSANGLPRKHSPNLLQLFSEGGLVPSDTSQQIRYQAGLATTLANTIRKIDGILNAKVIISFPEENPLDPNAPKKQITATVFVKHSGILDDPNSTIISQIKRLVSSSISGLSYDNVTVIGDRARFSLPSSSTEEHEVRVMGFTLAESSLVQFQVVIFVFIVAAFILLFLILWFIWKLYPIAKKGGGISQIFSISPIKDEQEIVKLEEVVEAKSEEKKPPEEKPPIQENVEE